jgi:GTP diphosphokinase / guanosine-3',5'-bis(diphosphate) 3'-diphosphatase
MKSITLEDVFKNMRVERTPERERRIRDAYALAEKAHFGQKRKSGEDYIQHSLYTALNIAHLGMGSKTISAALLHDVPEDTDVTLKEIQESFGEEIAFVVSGITKLGKIRLKETKEELYTENLRRMFLAMASDIRVVIIKLADRLHNMETLFALPPEKRTGIATETMEIFVPIANRLGIGEIKSRLEDLAFKYLDEKNYEVTKALEEKEYDLRKKNIAKVVAELKKELEKEQIKVWEIYGRNKSIYRLFLKLNTHEMDINKIYDLAGIRIIVPEVADCYETLGIVHKKYRPLIGRIKDYISLPKPNGYQSIHTTIFAPEGKFLEVQIRTKKMHDEAEFGIASHWLYSEYKRDWKSLFLFKEKTKVPKETLAWIEQLKEWQSELGKDNKEFIETLKFDFFKNHIFAFTPQGDVIDLPEDATPIDFAYKIHSEIGNQVIGTKADGKMVPLDYKIKNGEVIEIITSKERKMPNRDWLRFVITSDAKSHIRKALKKENLA